MDRSKDKKKTAIITLAYGLNYGNRLQNYALQQLLISEGFVAETIRHPRTLSNKLKARFLRRSKYCAKLILGKNIVKDRRKLCFNRFNRKYIYYSDFCFGADIAPAELSEAYDFFIVGSDQVWNAIFPDISSNIHNFLACFSPPEKRVSYAASFGSSSIVSGYEDDFYAELPKFRAISVRETDGVRLVEKCGAHAVVALDPTMMLSPQQWDSIARKPGYISNEHFIVTYFLGGRNEILNRFILSLADDRKVIHLEEEFIPEDKIDNPDFFATSPDEFVWLIAHADCVLTDSFHASVFSILYHKPFLVFERLIDGKSGGMGSRIDTLLGLFHLEHCRGDIYAPAGTPGESNWNIVDTILAEEQEKSLAFLRNALCVQ